MSFNHPLAAQRSFLAIAFIAVGASATAGGYTAPVMEPAPVVVAPVAGTDWTGFYAGLQYGQGTADLSFPAIEEEFDGEIDTEFDFDAYGFHIGYLKDFGTYVLGGEFDYNNVDFDLGDDADLMRLRGRVGYDLGRFMPYLTLGAARLSGDGVSETGMTYGVGADFLVSEKFSVGLEYTMQKFSDVEGVSGLDIDLDMIQIRASYHF